MQDSGFEVLGRITKHSHFIVSLIKGNSFEDHSNMAYRNRKSLKLTYIDNTDVGKIRLIFIAKFLTRLKMFKRLKSLLVLNILNLIKSFATNAYDQIQYIVLLPEGFTSQ